MLWLLHLEFKKTTVLTKIVIMNKNVIILVSVLFLSTMMLLVKFVSEFYIEAGYSHMLADHYNIQIVLDLINQRQYEDAESYLEGLTQANQITIESALNEGAISAEMRSEMLKALKVE